MLGFTRNVAFTALSEINYFGPGGVFGCPANVLLLTFDRALAQACPDGLDAQPAEDAVPRHKLFRLGDPSLLNAETGRAIGYDYAAYGLRPQPDAPQPVREGYALGVARLRKRASTDDMFVRKWLNLRYSAWRRNRVFDPSLTPDYLRRIYRPVCPITREAMTHGTASETDATVDRVFNDSAYSPGNLVFMCARANLAKANRCAEEIREIMLRNTDFEGLSAVEWKRLACLTNMLQPDVNARAKAPLMPLYVTPPPKMIITNPAVLVQESISSVAGGHVAPAMQTKFRSLTSGKAAKRSLDETISLLRRYHASAAARALPRTRERFRHTIEDAWLIPQVFLSFASWFTTLSDKQVLAMVEANIKMRGGAVTLSSSRIENWCLESRGYDVRED